MLFLAKATWRLSRGLTGFRVGRVWVEYPQHALHLEELWLSQAPVNAAFGGSYPGSPSLCHSSQNAMSRELGVGTEA